MDIELFFMKTVDILEAEKDFDLLVDLLLSGKEQTVFIMKNHVPVIQMVPVSHLNNQRIGAAKKEMDGFDISLEEFNSIPLSDFSF